MFYYLNMGIAVPLRNKTIHQLLWRLLYSCKIITRIALSWGMWVYSPQENEKKNTQKIQQTKNSEEGLLVMRRINLSEKYISVISCNPHEQFSVGKMPCHSPAAEFIRAEPGSGFLFLFRMEPSDSLIPSPENLWAWLLLLPAHRGCTQQRVGRTAPRLTAGQLWKQINVLLCNRGGRDSSAQKTLSSSA